MRSARPRYVASVGRDGDWWYIDVPSVPVHTQAREMDEVEHMARDAIGLMLEVPPDSFDVDIRVKDAVAGSARSRQRLSTKEPRRQRQAT